MLMKAVRSRNLATLAAKNSPSERNDGRVDFGRNAAGIGLEPDPFHIVLVVKATVAHRQGPCHSRERGNPEASTPASLDTRFRGYDNLGATSLRL